MNRFVVAGTTILVLTAGTGLVAGMDSSLSPGRAVAHTQPPTLSAGESRGLAYLIGKQMPNGGWSEGEESAHMRSTNHMNMKETANVADTAMAALAVLRCGNYPNKGTYAANLTRAAEFVCQSIEAADPESLYVTDIRGTRLQSKLGPYIDTFLAAQFLSEIIGQMPDEKKNKQVQAALHKVIKKIERHQGEDGQWAGAGWAPVHSQAIATRALNRASQAGIAVNESTLKRAEAYAKQSYDSKTGNFAAEGSAGVPLYAAGAALGALQESINTNKQKAGDLKKILASKSTSNEAKRRARDELQRFADAEKSQGMAISAVTKKFSDDRFVSGFGCNGGEEFLSYLNISETLLVSHSTDWPGWNDRITANLSHVQQDDGSWMGHHCITSRTFCTAAALMVLTVDCSPTLQAAAKATTRRKA